MTKIFVNGSFDIIHRGHLHLLNFAKSLGTELHVGIDADARITKLKGVPRPINKQQDRKFLLENLKAVDKVYIFQTEEELEHLVLMIRPNIMVVGEEYKDKRIIGSQYAGAICFFRRLEEYSTTKIIQNITDR